MVPKLSLGESRRQMVSFTEQTLEWDNPVGVSKEILHGYFEQFISGDLVRGRARSKSMDNAKNMQVRLLL